MMRDKPISSDQKSFALEVVLETALDAAIVIDDKGNVVAWNAVAERTFGWKFSEVSGAQLSKLIIQKNSDSIMMTGSSDTWQPALRKRLASTLKS